MRREVVDEQKVIMCACGMHAISIWADTEDPPSVRCVELSFWQYGQPRGEPWRERLRHIWRILTVGSPYSDMVVLMPEEARQLEDALAKASR
jgi:hypothetical protein